MQLDAERLTLTLDAAMPALMESCGTVAAAVAVTDERGLCVSRTYGQTSREEPRHVGAFADLYASLALLQCIERERLTLHLPLKAWLGHDIGLGPQFAEATAWHVLVGLVPDASRVAVRLVEVVTGFKYPDYLQRLLLRPLKLGRTRLEPEPTGLLTSVEDQAMVLWRIVQGRAEVLRPRTVANMVRPQASADADLTGRGLGVDIGGRDDAEWYGTAGVCACRWMGDGRAYPGMGVTVAAVDYSVLRGASTRLVEAVEGAALFALAEQRGELVGSGRR